MAKVGLQGRKNRLVLDIGASAVRLCELTPAKTGYQLTKFFQAEYDSDPSMDDDTKRQVRAAAINALLKQAKVRSRKVILGVPGQSVFTRCRELPPVPEYKVNQIVKYEIQQQIPFGLDQIAMDYQVLDRTAAGGYDVMMAAIKVDVVEKHLVLLRDAKCSIEIVDVCPIAAYNWMKRSGEFGTQGECIAVIDMGAATTNIVIERENQFRFTRPLNLGGNDVTQALAEAYNVSFKEAEQLKRTRAFAPTGDPDRDKGRGATAIGDALKRFTTEVQRSFAYFRSLPGGGQVNRVVLCGGAAALRNLVPYMQRQLGLEITLAQPLNGIQIGPLAKQVEASPLQATVALGLALRCCETVPIEINLIPPRVLEIARQKEAAVYWLLIFVGISLILASFIPGIANVHKENLKQIEQIQNAIGLWDMKLKGDIQRAEKAATGMQAPTLPDSAFVGELNAQRGKVKGLQKQVEALVRLYKERRFWLEAVELLSETRPSGVWFSSVESAVVTPPKAGAGGGAGAGAPTKPAAGPGGGKPGAATPQATAEGFPGLGTKAAAAPAGGRGGGGAGGGGGGAGGGAGGGGGRGQGKAKPVPNGLIVHGFAANDSNAILSFVNDLKSAPPRVLTNNGDSVKIANVFFSESTVDRMPLSQLADAPTDGVRAGEGSKAAGGEGGWNADSEQIVYSFTFNVLLEDTRFKKPNQPQPATATPTAPGATPPAANR